MEELTLSASPGNWRHFTARKADPAFLAFQEKVFERDGHACRFCHFQAQDYQEVINLDGNYQRNTLSNMVTVCCFCAQCFFLDMVGQGDYGGGTLIYLPEISQAHLNALCHVWFCAMSGGTAFQETAQSLYRTFRLRSQVVENTFGSGTSRPHLFAQLILESGPLVKDQEALLADLRLLPSHAKFKKQIEGWARGALSELPED